MQVTALKYGFSKTLSTSFDQAVQRAKDALQKQGFGVQAEINLSNALKEKLGVEVARQLILGACNPQIAYKALQAEPEISLLLPCNVTVRQTGDKVEVAVIDAGKLMEFVGNPELRPLADEVKRRLQAVLDEV
jgi:uncharacterized protein (DUF302 family)